MWTICLSYQSAPNLDRAIQILWWGNAGWGLGRIQVSGNKEHGGGTPIHAADAGNGVYGSGLHHRMGGQRALLLLN